MPRLSNLRESGSNEADSDAVLFIHCQNPAVNQDGRLLCQIVVSKNRSGRQGMFDICFVRDFSGLKIGEIIKTSSTWWRRWQRRKPSRKAEDQRGEVPSDELPAYAKVFDDCI